LIPATLRGVAGINPLTITELMKECSGHQANDPF
jgi:hypothetical protein